MKSNEIRIAYVVLPICFIFTLLFSMRILADTKSHDWLFVKTVLLESEFGNRKNTIIRWTHAPLFVAVLSKGPYREYVQNAVAEVNAAFSKSGNKIKLMFGEQSDFDGLIGIMPEKDFARMLKAMECRVSLPKPVNGRACLYIDAETHSIDSVLILVDSALEEEELKGALLEEIYQSLGVANDHQIYHESLFYDGPDRNIITRLAPIDKKVLLFLYKYLSPGDDETIVRQKFDKYWHTIQINE